MNQKTTYEQLITEKFGNRSVPDMEDMIWLRISSELDNDGPAGDDNDKPPAPPAPASFPWLKYSINLFFLTALVTYIIYKNKPTTEMPAAAPAVTTPTPAKEIQQTPQYEKLPPQKSRSIVPQKATVPDTTQQIPEAIPSPVIVPDSVVQVPPPAVAAPAITDSVKKKSRGVQGITDDDYRIIPSDSTKKKRSN